MDKCVDTPLIEDPDRRKIFLIILWCIYVGILCVSLVLEENLAQFMDNNLRLGSLGWLLYATYYFSCRAKGENFLFLIWGIDKPYSKGWLLSSDWGAAAAYISFLGILVSQLPL